MLPWKEVHHSKMHVLNLTNIYDVCNSYNCQTVTLNKRKCNATISLPISIQHIIRGPNGGLILIILGAQGGQKLRNYLKKKSKLSYKLKLFVSKLFLKVISTLYNCSKRIKTVGNLIRGYIRGSKRIKKGEISMKSEEINEI